jgi:hypothetical protein
MKQLVNNHQSVPFRRLQYERRAFIDEVVRRHSGEGKGAEEKVRERANKMKYYVMFHPQ